MKVAANMEAVETRVLSGEVKIIPSKLYGRHQLVDMVQFLITTNMLQLSYSLFLPHFYECGLSIYTNYQMCTFLDNKTGATCGVGFANGAPEATRGFNGDCSALWFFIFPCCFCVMFYFVFFVVFIFAMAFLV